VGIMSRGKIGEADILKKLIENGFEVYLPFVDVGVDFIARKETAEGVKHIDIQVKTSRYYPKTDRYWIDIRMKAFKAFDNYFYFFVLQKPESNIYDVLIIPSKTLEQYWKEGRLHYDKKHDRLRLFFRKEKDQWYQIRGKKTNLHKFLDGYELLGSSLVE